MIRNYIRRRRSVGSSGSPPPESASLTIQSAITFTAVTPGAAGNNIGLAAVIDGPQIDTTWFLDEAEQWYAVLNTTAGARPSEVADDYAIYHVEYPALGLLCLSRISSTDLKFYLDGVQVDTNAVATGTTLPNLNVYIGAQSTGGAPGLFWGGRFCFASIGRGLSAAQQEALAINVNDYNTALGR